MRILIVEDDERTSSFIAKGLTEAGKRLVEQLDAERIFVDLAHIHPDGFWDALDVHDSALPVLVTHTGVDGVCPHWRNLDNAQIRAVAETGGVVGIMAHGGFLRRRGGPRDGAMVVEHMEHVIDVAGEDAVALGTDYDGFISPPKDLRSGDSYPVLVQHMLDRGWSDYLQVTTFSSLPSSHLKVLRAKVMFKRQVTN